MKRFYDTKSRSERADRQRQLGLTSATGRFAAQKRAQLYRDRDKSAGMVAGDRLYPGASDAPENYRRIFDNAVEGIFQSTPDGRFVRVNPTMARIYHYESPRVMIHSITDVQSQLFVDPAPYRQLIRELETRGQVLDARVQNRCQDGTLIWVSASVRAVRGPDGAVQYFEGFVTDITEQERVKHALQASLLRYQETLNNMLEGCQIVDFDYRYVYVNDAVTRHGRRSKESLLSRTMMEVYPGIERTDMFRALRHCMEDRQPIQIENAFVYPDGATGWFELGMQPVPEGVFILSTDITLRKETELRLQQQVENLAALRAIDIAIAGSMDLRLTMNIALDQVVDRLQVDAADILLLDNQTLVLQHAAGRGFRTRGILQSRLRLDEGLALRGLGERTLVKIPDLEGSPDRFPHHERIAGEGFASYFAVPLMAKGQIKGMLEVFLRTPFEPSSEWLDFLEILAGQAAIAVDNAQLFAELQRSNIELSLAYDRTIEGWSRALDLRDRETEGHTLRVTEMTIALARRMGFAESEIVHIRRGALLHDIGKMGVPDQILFKPAALTEPERAVIRTHPVLAYDMLLPIKYLHSALDIPYYHHEKWNGSGYPRGLRGEQIPLMARVFSVADVWDALRSDRPYREGWRAERTRQYIQRMSGIQFDPRVVEEFLELTKDGDEQFRSITG